MRWRGCCADNTGAHGALDAQPGEALRWRVTDAAVAVPRPTGKVVVVGHTPQHSGKVLDLGYLIRIDTNGVQGG